MFSGTFECIFTFTAHPSHTQFSTHYNIQKFLKSEFSDENLKFWLDVEDYKSIMNLKEVSEVNSI